MPIQGVMPGDGLVGAAANASAPNYIKVPVNFSQVAWNVVGNHVLLNVSGVCRLRVWGIFTESLVVSGGAHTSLIVSCDGVNILAATTEASKQNEIWMWAGGSARYGPAYALAGGDGAIVDCLIGAKPVLLEVSVGPVVGGALDLHCVWEPMTPGAYVTAGDGSAPS